jgi:hypothetical protein
VRAEPLERGGARISGLLFTKDTCRGLERELAIRHGHDEEWDHGPELGPEALEAIQQPAPDRDFPGNVG